MSEEAKRLGGAAYGGAADIEGFIGYQDGSIVSREIIKADGGTMTFFAFDMGQGFSEHTSPYDAIVQVIDGKAEVTLGGVKHIIEKGQIMIMPSGIPHGLQAVERFKMLLSLIK